MIVTIYFAKHEGQYSDDFICDSYAFLDQEKLLYLYLGAKTVACINIKKTMCIKIKDNE